MRVWAVKGMKRIPSGDLGAGAHRAPAQAVLLLGQHDDAAPLGRLVGQRGQLRQLGQLARA